MIKSVQAAVGPPAALWADLSFSGSSITVPGGAPAQELQPQTSDWQLQAITPSQPPASVQGSPSALQSWGSWLRLPQHQVSLKGPPSCHAAHMCLPSHGPFPRGGLGKSVWQCSRAVSGNTSQGESTYTVLSKSYILVLWFWLIV